MASSFWGHTEVLKDPKGKPGAIGHGFQRSLWQHDDGAGPMASCSGLRGVFGDTWIILSKSIIAFKSHQGSASLFSLERHASALTYQISTAVLTAWWRRGSNCIHFVSSGSLRGYMGHFEQVYHRFEVVPRFCIPLLPRKACICPYLSDFNGHCDRMITAWAQSHRFFPPNLFSNISPYICWYIFDWLILFIMKSCGRISE